MPCDRAYRLNGKPTNVISQTKRSVFQRRNLHFTSEVAGMIRKNPWGVGLTHFLNHSNTICELNIIVNVNKHDMCT